MMTSRGLTSMLLSDRFTVLILSRGLIIMMTIKMMMLIVTVVSRKLTTELRS